MWGDVVDQAIISNYLGTPNTVQAAIALTRRAYTGRAKPIFFNKFVKFDGANTPVTKFKNRGQIGIKVRLQGKCDETSKNNLLILLERYVYVSVSIPGDAYIGTAGGVYALTSLDIEETPGGYGSRPYKITADLEKIYNSPP